jgi:RNA polymerase sigma factor (sigma-70 family)
VGELSVEAAFRKWGDDLVRFATAMVGPSDAADVVSEAFASVLSGGEDRWCRVREPRAYLFRAVANAARMWARGGARRRRRELRWPVDTVVGELLADPSVRRALDGLSVRQRAALFVTYWLDASPSEAASMLGVSEGAVKRHLARGRAALREVL